MRLSGGNRSCAVASCTAPAVRRGYCLAHFASMMATTSTSSTPASVATPRGYTTDNIPTPSSSTSLSASSSSSSSGPPQLGRAHTLAVPNSSIGGRPSGMAPTPRNSVIGTTSSIGGNGVIPIASLAALAAARLAGSVSMDSELNDDTPRTIAQQRYINEEAEAADIDTIYARIQRPFERTDSEQSIEDYEANERARLILLAERQKEEEDDAALVAGTHEAPIPAAIVTAPTAATTTATSTASQQQPPAATINPARASGPLLNVIAHDPRGAMFNRQHSYNGSEQHKQPPLHRAQSDRRAVMAAHQSLAAAAISNNTAGVHAQIGAYRATNMNESRGTYQRRRSFSDDDPHAAMTAAYVAQQQQLQQSGTPQGQGGFSARSSGTFSHPHGPSGHLAILGSPSMSPAPSTPVERLMRSALTGMPPLTPNMGGSTISGAPASGTSSASISSRFPVYGSNNGGDAVRHRRQDSDHIDMNDRRASASARDDISGGVDDHHDPYARTPMGRQISDERSYLSAGLVSRPESAMDGAQSAAFANAVKAAFVAGGGSGRSYPIPFSPGPGTYSAPLSPPPIVGGGVERGSGNSMDDDLTLRQQRRGSSEPHSPGLPDISRPGSDGTTPTASADTTSAPKVGSDGKAGATGGVADTPAERKRSLWHSPIHAINFLTRLSAVHDSNRPHHPSVSDMAENEMSEEQFNQMAETLSRDDQLSAMSYMFKSLKQFRTLLTETKTISTDLDKSDAFSRVVNRIRTVLHAEHAMLFLVEKGRGSDLKCAASTHKNMSTYMVPFGRGFEGWCIAHKESINIRSNVTEDPRYMGELADVVGAPIRNLLLVPVFNKARQIVAVLEVVNKTKRPQSKAYFTDQDQAMVEFIALHAGHTIENALLYDEAISRRGHTETLLQITELMSAEIDTDKVIQRVIEASYLLVNAERITLFMVDDATEELVSVVSKDNKESIRIPLAKGIVGYVATTGKIVNARNAQDDWRFDMDADRRSGLTVNSILTVPVNDHLGKTVAVIEAINKRFDDSFSRDEEALLQSMAVSAGIVLRKAQLYEEAVTRRKQTEALLQITELMSAELGVSKVIQKIVQAAYMLVNADRITLYMVDERRHELVCEVSKDRQTAGRRIPLGQGVAGHVALTGRVVNIPNAAADWRYDPALDEEQKYRTKTILALPVKDYLGKAVAVIEVINKKAPPPTAATSSGRSHSSSMHGSGRDGDGGIVAFNPDDETVLKSLAVTAGTVLRKARLFDEAITRRRQLEALLQITELMSAEIGSEKVMQRIIEASYTLVNAERITLFSVDPITKDLVCKVSKDPLFQGVRIAYGHGIVGHVAQTRRSLNIPNAYADPRFDSAADRRTGYKTKSILTTPVTDRKGACVAIIQAVNKRGSTGRFTTEDVSILESMAVSAGIILHKSRLYDAAVFADRKSRALMNLVKAASVEGSIEVIINGIAKVGYEALNCDRVTIYFVDHVSEEVWCIVCKDVEGWSLPLGKGLAGWTAKSGQPLNVSDAYDDPRFDASWDKKTAYRTKSVLCMPVKDKNGVTIAVIQALNKHAAPTASQSLNTGEWDTSERAILKNDRDIGPPPTPSQLGHVPGTPAASGGRDSGSRMFNFSNAASQSTSVGATSSTATGTTSTPSTPAPSGLPPRATSPLIPFAAPQWDTKRSSGSSSTAHTDLSRSLAGTAATAAAIAAGTATDDEKKNWVRFEDVVPFNQEDEEILEAFCVEVRAIIRRYQTEAMIEMSQFKMNDSVYSLMDMHSGPTNNSSLARLAPGLTRRGVESQRTGGGRSFQQTFVWPDIKLSKLGELNDLEFNVWTKSPDDLLVYSYQIFEEMNLLNEFQIPADILKNFFLQVRSKYHDNPFHNWHHGFSVLHFSYLALRSLSPQAAAYLTSQDVLALLVSSLCHDIDHPGNTNSYEINSNSDLALRHNDISVLENHHAFTTFSILRQQPCNIFGNLRRETFQFLKKTIVAAILNTDMTVHFESCKSLDGREPEAPFNAKSEADRQQVINLLIHSADLSGQVFPTPVAKVWEESITREFEAQAKKEKAKGIPVAPFMINLSDPILRNQNQVNFIDFVLVPWWRSVTRIFPGMKVCYKNLLENRAYYNSFAKAGKPEEKAATSPPTPAKALPAPASSVTPTGASESAASSAATAPAKASTPSSST